MDFEAIVSRVREALPGTEAVYLFGSRAQGTATAESDLDLAVLAPEPLDPVVLWTLSGQLADQAGCDVDVVDLRSATIVMQHQVIRNGQCLWQQGQAADFYECHVFSRYWDWEITRRPLLQSIREEGRIHG